MMDATDMSTPVARGELRAERAQFEQRLAHFATKTELEMWGGAVLERIVAVEQRMLVGEQRLLARIESGEQRTIERMDGLEQRLLMELVRHTQAISESLSRQVSIIDESTRICPCG